MEIRWIKSYSSSQRFCSKCSRILTLYITFEEFFGQKSIDKIPLPFQWTLQILPFFVPNGELLCSHC
jgi:hypothetical protein